MSQKVGRWGEEQASLFLLRNGYTFIARNFYAGVGELDIIAFNSRGNLCFIEVKTRSGFPGSAERATSRHKQRKMQDTAKAFCYEFCINPDEYVICFEHVSVYVCKLEKKILFKKYQFYPNEL